MGPQVPRPGSRRGRELASQRQDIRDRYFPERFIEFSYPPIVRFTQVTQRITLSSMGSPFIRVVALRATLVATSDAVQTGMELASLLLRVQIGAENDLITTGGGNRLNATSFAILNGGQPDPWFWFTSPPRLHVGDTVQCTITNGAFTEAGAAPILTPELTFRVMDDLQWRRLYEMQLAAELDAAADYERGAGP